MARQRELPERLGGRPGARLGSRLRLPANRSTLLRLVRGAVLPTPAPPRVLGVDDWAWRRGQRYGSILVEVENHTHLHKVLKAVRKVKGVTEIARRDSGASPEVVVG